MQPQPKPEMSQTPPGGKFTAAGFEDDDSRAIGHALVKLPPTDASSLLDYLYAIGAAADSTQMNSTR